MASHTGFGGVTKKVSKMRPRLLWLLAAAHGSKWPAPPDDSVDAYVRSWAAGGTARRCGDVGAHGDCSWMSGFGPIDVACTIHIDRVGLLDDKRGPALTLKFHDGEELSISTENAHNIDRFITRPALCEYVPKHRPVQATDAGLVMVSNSPSYLLRLWPPFLNKLLYATDAGLRTFLWIGELPEGLEKPSSQACFDSVQVTQHHRRLRSFYDSRHGDAPRGGALNPEVELISNHYVKMPAALAALAAPGIEGVYYVDLDSVTRHPWTVDPLFASEHTNRYSDVSFKYGFVEGADNSGTLRWKVHGSRFYARNSIKGRAFFANWFANRCTFKDQYSLWHTILNFAASEGCVDYAGEIYSKFRYTDAKHLKQDKARAEFPMLVLDCARIDQKCPKFPFANVGGDSCDVTPPRLIDQVFHHTIPQEGHGTFEVPLSRSTLIVENACISTIGTPLVNATRCEHTDDLRAYVERLGIPTRWNS